MFSHNWPVNWENPKFSTGGVEIEHHSLLAPADKTRKQGGGGDRICILSVLEGASFSLTTIFHCPYIENL